MIRKLIKRYREKRMIRQVSKLQKQLELESEKLTINLGNLLHKLTIYSIVIIEDADSKVEHAVNELLKEQKINKN